MKPTRFAISWILLGALTAVGCSDSNDNTQAPIVVPECSGPVEVSVSPGANPIFSWEPDCRLFLLLVEPSGSGGDVWSVVSDSTNAIEPPVTYGVVPDGAVGLQPPGVLVQGVTYDVYLYRWTGPGRQDGEFIGSAEFTR